MAQYSYKARQSDGKLIKGRMSARSDEELAEKLRHMGCAVTSIREVEPGVPWQDWSEKLQRIKSTEMILFDMQLANMIESGLPILGSLNTLSEQIDNKRLKNVIKRVSLSISSGETFSEALSQHPSVFHELFVNMVKAGETGGKLSNTLNRYAAYVEEQEDLKQKVKSALFYPCVLFVISILIIIFIVSFVIPKFVVMFTKAHVELPLPTMIIYHVGQVIIHSWYIVILAFGLAVASVVMYAKTRNGKSALDHLKLKVPVVGSIVRQVIISRFCRTLATLIESGVPLLTALDVMSDVVGNEVYREAIGHARRGVEKGERLADPIKQSRVFPADMIQMILVGEESGKLAKMLNKVADFYDKTINYAIKKMITLIEPIFIVVMGSMVGFIMASLILPLFDMVKTLRH